MRFVAEIAEITDVTETGKVAMNRIFGPVAAHEQAGSTPVGGSLWPRRSDGRSPKRGRSRMPVVARGRRLDQPRTAANVIAVGPVLVFVAGAASASG